MPLENNPPEPQDPSNPPAPSDPSSGNQEPTPPTNQPPALATDDLAMLTIRAQNERIAQLEAQLNKRGNEPPPPPPKSKEELRQEFYDDPVGATQRVIRDELRESIEPLRDFVKTFRGQSRVDQLLDAAKRNPKFATHWGPKLEQYVRSQLEQVDLSTFTEQAFNFLILSAIGLKASGFITEDAALSNNPPTPNTPVAGNPPPYFRPSATPPAGPAPDPNAPSRPLTELELRVLREYNNTHPRKMTEKEFLDWQNVPANEVATSRIGRAK